MSDVTIKRNSYNRRSEHTNLNYKPSKHKATNRSEKRKDSIPKPNEPSTEADGKRNTQQEAEAPWLQGQIRAKQLVNWVIGLLSWVIGHQRKVNKT